MGIATTVRPRGRQLASSVLLLGLVLGRPLAAADLDPPAEHAGYRLGVFPYLPALGIDRIFGPVAADFAKELGRPVDLRTKSTFEKFVAELKRQTYDIIFVHPFFYVEAADEHNYVPLARLDGVLTAVFMVRDDSPMQRLADLRGRTVALPPELAAVTDLAKGTLLDAGLKPGQNVKFRHYRTKASCLQAVAIGSADVCVLPKWILGQIAIQELPLRPLHESAQVSNVVFAAHARLPSAERALLQRCILDWPNRADGRSILAIGDWPRFVAARDADYDEVRRHKRRLSQLAQR